MTACADKIWIQEGVELFWSGIGGTLNSYGELLERYGLRADVEAAGAFKSFGEQFTRTEPSEANRTQLLEIYDSLYQVLLTNLAQDTQVDKSRLAVLLHESQIPITRLQRTGLVAGESNLFSIKERVAEYTNSQRKPLSFTHYMRANRWVDWWTWGNDGTTNIALVHLNGSIVDFEQDQEGIVADRVVRQLEQLKDMSWIDAVVLKINSPGGSAIASDQIATAIEHLRHDKK